MNIFTVKRHLVRERIVLLEVHRLVIAIHEHVRVVARIVARIVEV